LSDLQLSIVRLQTADTHVTAADTPAIPFRPETPSEFMAAIDSHLQAMAPSELKTDTMVVAEVESPGVQQQQQQRGTAGGKIGGQKRALVRRKQRPSSSSSILSDTTEARLRNQLTQVSEEDGFYVCRPVEMCQSLTEEDYETNFNVLDLHALVASLPAFDRSAPQHVDWGQMLDITPISAEGAVRVYDFVQAFLSTPLSVGGLRPEDTYSVPDRSLILAQQQQQQPPPPPPPPPPSPPQQQQQQQQRQQQQQQQQQQQVVERTEISSLLTKNARSEQRQVAFASEVLSLSL